MADDPFGGLDVKALSNERCGDDTRGRHLRGMISPHERRRAKSLLNRLINRLDNKDYVSKSEKREILKSIRKLNRQLIVYENAIGRLQKQRHDAAMLQVKCVILFCVSLWIFVAMMQMSKYM